MSPLHPQLLIEDPLGLYCRVRPAHSSGVPVMGYWPSSEGQQQARYDRLLCALAHDIPLGRYRILDDGEAFDPAKRNIHVEEGDNPVSA